MPVFSFKQVLFSKISFGLLSLFFILLFSSCGEKSKKKSDKAETSVARDTNSAFQGADSINAESVDSEAPVDPMDSAFLTSSAHSDSQSTGSSAGAMGMELSGSQSLVAEGSVQLTCPCRKQVDWQFDPRMGTVNLVVPQSEISNYDYRMPKLNEICVATFGSQHYGDYSSCWKTKNSNGKQKA